MSRLVLCSVSAVAGGFEAEEGRQCTVAGGRSKCCARSQIQVKCLQRDFCVEYVGETLDGQEISKDTKLYREERESRWKTRLVHCSVPCVKDGSEALGASVFIKRKYKQRRAKSRTFS